MFIDPSSITPWLSLVALLLSVGGVIYAWLTRGSAANTEKIKKVEDDFVAIADRLDGRVTRATDRLQKVENELEHLPRSDTVNSIQLSLERLSGRLDVMTESLKPVKAIADRMQELMLEGGTSEGSKR